MHSKSSKDLLIIVYFTYLTMITVLFLIILSIIYVWQLHSTSLPLIPLVSHDQITDFASSIFFEVGELGNQ